MDIYEPVYDHENHFLGNKYTKWYYNIINSRRQLERKKSKDYDSSNFIYYESHHIIPECEPFNGSNRKENRVLLTFKEHLIIHWLLTKMCEGQKKYKMFHGLHMITNNTSKNTRDIPPIWILELGRQANSKAGKYRKGIPTGFKGVSNIERYGEERAKEIYEKCSKFQKERLRTDQEIERLKTLGVGHSPWNKGVPMEEESKEKMRNSDYHSNRIKIIAIERGKKMVGTKQPEETKQKRSLSLRDKTLYEFYHKQHGIVISTRYNFEHQYSIDSGDMSRLINGIRNMSKGWTVKLASPCSEL